MSFPRTVVLVLALLQAFGITDLVRRQVCEAECKRDGCDDDCAPGNDSGNCVCHCPSAPVATTPAIAVVTLIAPTSGSDLTFDPVDRVHPSPDPREILHVPRFAV